MKVLVVSEHYFSFREFRSLSYTYQKSPIFDLQIARRALIAMHQYAVYKEYLPKLLGQGLMSEFGLTPLTNGNTRKNYSN